MGRVVAEGDDIAVQIVEAEDLIRCWDAGDGFEFAFELGYGPGWCDATFGGDERGRGGRGWVWDDDEERNVGSGGVSHCAPGVQLRSYCAASRPERRLME